MKKLVILGGGESGVGAAILGKKKHWDVFLSDKGKVATKYAEVLNQHTIRWEENKHTESEILSADCIIKSPGIPDTVEIIKKAKEKHIEIISEIEFAYRYTKGKIIAITGSNGKTTTTSLTYHILKESGLNVGVAGNIGKSFAQMVAEDDKEYYVLEISSFQLDGITSFKPHIAILLNITPDHLDRYDYKMENYIASKFRITENQTENDYFIYDIDDPIIAQWLEKNEIKSQKIPFSIEKKLNKGIYSLKDIIHMNIDNQTFEIEVKEMSLKGKHNIKNSMAASVSSRLLKVRKESIRESLKGFVGEPHRLEFVKTVEGITYINDSKATNVNSVFFALDTMKTPVVWIVGGVDKGNDYSPLLPYVHEKVRAIICLGKDNSPILKSFGNVIDNIVETQSMEEAVSLSKQFAKNGDTVLLSPACASFDLFKNYEERGNEFKKEVEKL
ncbi:UDP-N-acetylmuramoyl-L-alanine--D-glutamate ligase [Capnocytophaga canimorsus]|uniref:UDP-N-acetylmuramoyl-L-alanine--D-glutamate ligase n=1 Tax=Capnocytophaga canimorsus TaxID=28188 RepID=UPI000BB179E2|nr:UDP-N-acetylmuramoyl-L-alanine--D-glutamate ligase [Capnocytophaga canimorsus]ATA77177.1 UDP-N-acetylmuramoyl-L-alanine--D-glutamate ligase [Capnocytophaga canimorsus]PJI83675.1 UDP-N-acetylmuramoylalanine--D-glutamate ligase [Capnocytophaga canimorsus]STA72401.1 UDP-N-acetylmuramoylalanine--D-glutamate ligase [Capnocytophaga canimorsus]